MQPQPSEGKWSGGGSEGDRAAFDSVPWTRLEVPADTPGNNNNNTDTTVIWHKAGIPYLDPEKACALQTLDVWIPSDNTPNPPSLPSPGSGTWIIYIHGGAWRDPAITSSSFTPAATNLLRRNTFPQTQTPKIAGLISLNYRLSPHPSHPAPNDPSRQAAHPDHIADVLAGLSFTHRHILGTTTTTTTGEKPPKYILTGHSCGATLTFQALMNPARWGLSPPDPAFTAVKPAAVVGFNGLYDLAGFIQAPPEGYGHLREGYREFVEGAFGRDEGVWSAVCPATAGVGWVGEWLGESENGGQGEKEGEGDDDDGRGEKKGVVVLVQSREDTLVPWRQVEVMRACLEREGRGRVDVKVLEAEGEHDEIWRDGRRMAEVLWEVVVGLE